MLLTESDCSGTDRQESFRRALFKQVRVVNRDCDGTKGCILYEARIAILNQSDIIHFSEKEWFVSGEHCNYSVYSDKSAYLWIAL